jgi:hypothetical protein
VIATTFGVSPTLMSPGFLVLVFTSMVDTVPLPCVATKAVLPSGVTATPPEFGATMSVGFFVLVFTSIVDTESLAALATMAVARQSLRATADTRSGTTPTSAPAKPSTNTPRPRNRGIAAPCPITGGTA